MTIYRGVGRVSKIGIINYQYSNHNYGAVLQAAALHYYISHKLELESEHIDYIPSGLHSDWKTKIKSVILKVLMILGVKKNRIMHDLILNSQAFETFRKQWLPRTKSVYNSYESLENADFDYSHVVVGSDQIWRPSYTGNSALVYFLEFLNDGVKRVSYAASFGNDSWELDEAQSNPIIDAVRKFSAISVREKSGVDICNEVFSINAEHALDPTLLVGREFFEMIIGSECKAQHSGVVCYKLDVDKAFEEFLSSASSALKVSSKIIYFNKICGVNSYHDVSDWLSYIKNCKFVITDSFHCVCFALLFERPFVYYPNDNRGLTRLESLLGELGLDAHIYRGGDIGDLIGSLSEINYSEVNKKLDVLRAGSAEFLSNSLQG